jgi:hypothetical protein
MTFIAIQVALGDWHGAKPSAASEDNRSQIA